MRTAAGPGTPVHALELDVASLESIEAAVQHIRSEFDQQLDCIVNSAGAWLA